MRTFPLTILFAFGLLTAPQLALSQSRNIYGVNRSNNTSGVRRSGSSMIGVQRGNIYRSQSGSLARNYFGHSSRVGTSGAATIATGSGAAYEYHPAPQSSPAQENNQWQ